MLLSLIPDGGILGQGFPRWRGDSKGELGRVAKLNDGETRQKLKATP